MKILSRFLNWSLRRSLLLTALFYAAFVAIEIGLYHDSELAQTFGVWPVIAVYILIVLWSMLLWAKLLLSIDYGSGATLSHKVSIIMLSLFIGILAFMATISHIQRGIHGLNSVYWGWGIAQLVLATCGAFGIMVMGIVFVVSLRLEVVDKYKREKSK